MLFLTLCHTSNVDNYQIPDLVSDKLKQVTLENALLLFCLEEFQKVHAVPFQTLDLEQIVARHQLYRRQEQIVGYADLLIGRVTITQLAQGFTRIYGQFNVGFDGGSPSDYTIVFKPSGFRLSDYVTYQINSPGISAFQVDLTNVRLDNDGPGTNVACETLEVYKNGKLLGKGDVITDRGCKAKATPITEPVPPNPSPIKPVSFNPVEEDTCEL
ncbi:hypothetical protein G9A89_020828 [Geosiphon pyriformis]|nr:hypothetical protein G9A89_020828 [Geosiphon pyriformis]